MYTEADLTKVQAELKKRWLVSALPTALLAVAAIAVFVVCQMQRRDWGWIFACACTILGGAYFLFFWGVYLQPMRVYRIHVSYMLEGRMRETDGVVQDIADEPRDREGIECYELLVNIGDKGDPEDERLLYWDAQKGKPWVQVGMRVHALSNDRMISDIRET